MHRWDPALAIAVGVSATVRGNVPAGQKIRAVAAIKAHALQQAAAYASRDGAVLLATENAPEVFPNRVTIAEYAHHSATALALKVIFRSTAVSNVKVALEIPATDTAHAFQMVHAIVILNTGDVPANSNAREQMTEPMDTFVWVEAFAMYRGSANAKVFTMARTVLSLRLGSLSR